MTLPANYYRDPLKVVIAEESRTCAGCVHKELYFGIQFCGKHPEKQAKDLRKCKAYKERT